MDPEQFRNTEDIFVFLPEEDNDPELRHIKEYLQMWGYLEGLNRKEKSVFQHRIISYSMIGNMLLWMGADDKIRRCLEAKYQRIVMQSLHDGPS